MQSAYLLALTTARGIDLKRVAGASSELDKAAAERKLRKDERESGVERVPLTVRGSESRVYRRPAYSHAELAMAAARPRKPGSPAPPTDLPWIAARYSYAGDPSSYWPLWWALCERALRIAVRDGWAPLVPGRLEPRHDRTDKPLPGAKAGPPHFYLPLLARLVLDEDANKRAFAVVPELFPLYMQIEERMWERVMLSRFRSLHEVYERWLGTARGLIQRRISEAVEQQELRAAGDVAYIRGHNLKAASNTRA